MVARVCEEFPCLSPSAALQELEQTPVGWVFEVMEARAYARAKGLFDAATTADARARLPRSALMDLVTTITFELAQQEIDRHG